MKNQVRVLQLLPAFKKKFFYNYGKQLIPYALQRRNKKDMTDRQGKVIPAGSIGYDYKKAGTINDQLLLNHFKQEPIDSTTYEYSSLAVAAGGWDTLKWIAIDADSPEQIQASHEKILPALAEYEIEPLIETGRDGRMHIWIFGDFDPITSKKFILQLFSELELQLTKWEVYPLFDRKDAVIRIPGGFHFKANGVSGVISEGKTSADPAFVMQAIINAPSYTEEFLKSKLKFLVPDSTPQRVKKEFKAGKFTYLSRQMPLPMEGMPRYLEVVSTECQAIRKLIYDSVQNDQIDKAGINHHNTLLLFAGLSRFIDSVEKSDSGTKWFDRMTTHFRRRGFESHGLEAKPGKSANAGAWRCETIDKYFGLCEGCPFRKRDGFDNPKQFFFGKKIRMIKVEDVH